MHYYSAYPSPLAPRSLSHISPGQRCQPRRSEPPGGIKGREAWRRPRACGWLVERGDARVPARTAGPLPKSKGVCGVAVWCVFSHLFPFLLSFVRAPDALSLFPFLAAFSGWLFWLKTKKKQRQFNTQKTSSGGCVRGSLAPFSFCIPATQPGPY